MSSRRNQDCLKGEKGKENFEFLIPLVPPIKNGRNVIPTGKQIPRTPIKPLIPVTKPDSPKDESESYLSGREELEPKNFIPKGREIPRTPPNYREIPFLLSGCQVKQAFSQDIDLGVQPIEDVDDLDNVAIKEDFVTFRKPVMPKGYNIDLALSEMVKEVQLQDIVKSSSVDESLGKSTKLCIPDTSDIKVHNNEVSEENNRHNLTVSIIGSARNNFKDNIAHQGCSIDSESIEKDVIELDEVVAVKNKRGRPRAVTKKPSSLSNQEVDYRDGVANGKKKGRCRNKTDSGVPGDGSKDIVKLQGCIDAEDSILEDVNKQNEDVNVENKKGKMKRVPKGSSFISKHDSECCDKDLKLAVDKNQENLSVPDQEIRKSQSSERGRRRKNKSAMSSELNIRRNPSRRAKEGVNYRLPE